MEYKLTNSDVYVIYQLKVAGFNVVPHKESEDRVRLVIHKNGSVDVLELPSSITVHQMSQIIKQYIDTFEMLV